MPLKVGYVIEEAIINSGPAKNGFTSHNDVKNSVKDSLSKNGYTVSFEHYRMTPTKDVVQGIHYTTSGHILIWVNSYVNSFGFRCVLGKSYMDKIIINRTPNICKMRTGLTISDIDASVQSQLNTVSDISKIDETIDSFINMPIDKLTTSSIIGQLLFIENILNLTQVGILKKQLDLSVPKTVLELFEKLTDVLDESHPYSYIDDRLVLYNYLKNYFKPTISNNGINVPVSPVTHREVIDVIEIMKEFEQPNMGVIFM
jgi:hypothetical protein